VTVNSVHGYFEIYDLAVSGADHNYLANGIPCHNKSK
jgi:hypothetical protein